MPIEYNLSFTEEGDWQRWQCAHGGSLGAATLKTCIETIKRNGITSRFFGHISSDEIQILGSNYREKLLARGLNSRQRATLELLSGEAEARSGAKTKIYAPEAVTSLALALRARFPFFLGSEYAASPEEKERLYPIQSEDLQALSLKSDAFDVVLTCDVLEHVPSLKACLRELARVLKPGGVMISTHPFTWATEHRVKAQVVEGEIIHLEEAEYHGNPIDPRGSLVFTVPGWRILEDCKQSGFASAEMLMIASTRAGILGSDGFVNVLRAYK